MKLTLAYSPCPNDTFIFDAMIHGRIDTEGLEFEVVLADVEELNRTAFEYKPDITKLSYHAFAYCTDKYQLLHSGSALGSGCGPLLISNTASVISAIKQNASIAIPGKNTTANFLLNLALPSCQNKKEMLFSDIEQAVLNKEVDYGLIIHENRFTYQDNGLHKIIDLGQWWEDTTGHPIPLGGIAVKRSYPQDLKERINRVLKRSIEYAFANPKESMPYIAEHAQEMDPEVMQSHIDLYVNDFSIELGEQGINAIESMYELAFNKELIEPFKVDTIFV